MGYTDVLSRKEQILHKALGFAYRNFTTGTVAFDYEAMMSSIGHTISQIHDIQKQMHVGSTPLLELHNLTAAVRRFAPRGKGARIFVKDEAANPSGSFKDRRAALSIHEALKHGYQGVIAATSGNYGAAVASQAAQHNLACIIIQEAYDSRFVGQPEIMEKARKCESFGAEVVQLTVGPELFYLLLKTLDETGFFNASLYTPYSIAGIETLGYEIGTELQSRYQQRPAAVVVTHAGGGNITGTARGLKKCGCGDTEVIAASITLEGLHMASDTDFNKKSCTTGHTGFGVPFAVWPDRTDVLYNAARPLRYMDRYVTVTQGEVFFVTEALACMEGLERGPAGNTSLAAAIPIAAAMDKDEIIVVQETEYTGAGKHHASQLSFAQSNGISVTIGSPADDRPGKAIVLPQRFDQLHVVPVDLEKLRHSYIKNALKQCTGGRSLQESDIAFMAQDLRMESATVQKVIAGVSAERNEK
ncbi:MAG: PLP-dependent lyase/thiolase [Chitinivibrionales bacterium]|nr:PLP-dependent lyase/thiolase [Chitinivibrionales bacterium]